MRVTIGEPTVWSLNQAREKAREFQRQIDEGKDPRQLKAQAIEQAQAVKKRQQQDAHRQTATGLQAWAEYCQEGIKNGFSTRGAWGERHTQDHRAMVASGGTPYKGNKQGMTQSGPLYALLSRPLVELDAHAVAEWLKEENAHRPTRAALAYRLLRGFMNWCATHAIYKDIAQARAYQPKEVRRLVRKQEPKKDALLREQLPAWFGSVTLIQNPVISAYLQVLLLTGARPAEIRLMRWEDVNAAWRSLTIRDKVEGERMIPLTPYVHHLIASLPRRNEWVFSSARQDGALTEPTHAHIKVCQVAGIGHITLHGLRRSFKSLTEWLEIPAGVVAQIQGHKPSATAEKHYTVRPLDLLRVHHERIEGWILEQAGITFDSKAEVGRLRVVA
jgi:integrase